MRYRIFLIVFLSSLFLIGTIFVTAQSDGVEVSDAVCSPALDTLWAAASNACIGGPVGFICNGGGAPQVEPAGPVSNALAPAGALVEVGVVESLHTPPLLSQNDNGGLVWLRLAEPIGLSGLLVGDVSVRNVTPPDFPAWQSMVVKTGAEQVANCGVAPRNAFVVQTPVDPETGQIVSTNIVINGASLVLNGTVMVQTSETETTFVNLGGTASVLARGQEQPFLTGEQLSVPYAPGDFTVPAGVPTTARPLDVTLAANLPVSLLDRPLQLPQPGYVSTAGMVNMRTEPGTHGGLIAEVPAGELMTVLGRNPAGDWLHVRLTNGLTGWMFAELLVQNLGNVQAIYEATPMPPQRYGEMGRTARVVAPAGVNIREAPDVQFGRIVTLPPETVLTLMERSPHGPWVKVEHNGVVGWAALIALETEAIIEALPIDFDVTPPPPPTRVPGSFGNAFPDPRNNN